MFVIVTVASYRSGLRGRVEVVRDAKVFWMFTTETADELVVEALERHVARRAAVGRVGGPVHEVADLVGNAPSFAQASSGQSVVSGWDELKAGPRALRPNRLVCAPMYPSD
jgi:hypothetical protein